MTYYKVIKNGKSFHGGEFDWTPYLPKPDGSPGDWTPEIVVNPCHTGYHVTRFWNMWYENGARIFECEVSDDQQPDVVGVEEKNCFRSIRLIREFAPGFNGNRNTGNRNTGNWNTGDHNTGDQNTGDQNTGHQNTGDHNTGDRNTGNWNTGHQNTGDQNTGDRNTGNWNTGNWNTGDQNTGDRNTGDQNTGDRNTGHQNTGNWNTASRQTGYFNSTDDGMIRVFNRPCSQVDWENAKKPDFIFFDIDPKLGYKGSFQRSFETATAGEISMLKALPNFDADVFFEISGIDLR